MQIIPGIYLVGSQDCYLTYTEMFAPVNPWVDSNVFAVDLAERIILFDCGNGFSLDQICENMRCWDLNPERITHCFLTHPHFDHAAAAYLLRERGVKICAHKLCADAVESGDERTIGYFYHKPFHPCLVDIRFDDEDQFELDGFRMDIVHTPGHADGSVVYTFIHNDRKLSVTGDLVAEFGSLGWTGPVDFNRKAYIQSLRKMLSHQLDIILPGHRRPALSRGYIWVEQGLTNAIEQWGTEDKYK